MLSFFCGSLIHFPFEYDSLNVAYFFKNFTYCRVIMRSRGGKKYSTETQGSYIPFGSLLSEKGLKDQLYSMNLLVHT